MIASCKTFYIVHGSSGDKPCAPQPVAPQCLPTASHPADEGARPPVAVLQGAQNTAAHSDRARPGRGAGGRAPARARCAGTPAASRAELAGARRGQPNELASPSVSPVRHRPGEGSVPSPGQPQNRRARLLFKDVCWHAPGKRPYGGFVL